MSGVPVVIGVDVVWLFSVSCDLERSWGCSVSVEKAEASGAVFEGSLVVIFLVGRAMNEPTRQKEVTNPPNRNDLISPSDRSDEPTERSHQPPRQK